MVRPFRLTQVVSLITHEYIHFFHSRSCAIHVLENICFQCSRQGSHGGREGMLFTSNYDLYLFSLGFICSLFITRILLSYKREQKYVGKQNILNYVTAGIKKIKFNEKTRPETYTWLQFQ